MTEQEQDLARMDTMGDSTDSLTAATNEPAQAPFEMPLRVQFSTEDHCFYVADAWFRAVCGGMNENEAEQIVRAVNAYGRLREIAAMMRERASMAIPFDPPNPFGPLTNAIEKMIANIVIGYADKIDAALAGEGGAGRK